MKTLLYATSISLFFLPVISWAKLVPVDDATLGDVVGQAYIEMDSFVDNTTKFSRITFGENIKIQANADKVEFGNYDRTDETLTSDISLQYVSLGHIDETTNEIIPFEVNNPYFEWATDEITNDIIGFRMGFEEASGVFQADFESFTGNIGLQFEDGSNNTFDGALLNNTGEIDMIRSNLVGISSTDCTASDGSGSCSYSADNIKSLNVGDSTNSPTSDFFLSFQSKNLTWKWSDGIESTSYDTSKGFFMNIPTHDVITLGDAATTGTQIQKVQFIDTGIGRWE